MRDYGMFSKQGNAAVAKIVDEAIALYEVSEYGLETVWNWACNELEALGRLGVAKKQQIQQCVKQFITQSYNGISHLKYRS